MPREARIVFDPSTTLPCTLTSDALPCGLAGHSFLFAPHSNAKAKLHKGPECARRSHVTDVAAITLATAGRSPCGLFKGYNCDKRLLVCVAIKLNVFTEASLGHTGGDANKYTHTRACEHVLKLVSQRAVPPDKPQSPSATLTDLCCHCPRLRGAKRGCPEGTTRLNKPESRQVRPSTETTGWLSRRHPPSALRAWPVPGTY